MWLHLSAIHMISAKVFIPTTRLMIMVPNRDVYKLSFVYVLSLSTLCWKRKIVVLIFAFSTHHTFSFSDDATKLLTKANYYVSKL